MKWYKIFLAGLMVLVTQTGWAAHLVGGEFKILHKGNFSYDIQLNVYADNATLVPGNTDPNASVSVFEIGTNQKVESFLIPLGPMAFVPYVNIACRTNSIQTKILTYQITRVFNPQIYTNPAGYYIVWERCCRNQGVRNIVNPGWAGFIYYAEFPAVVKNGQPFINSTPVLPPVPPDVLCVGGLYEYSMQATDHDGDSLVYKLSDPINGHADGTLPYGTGQSGPYPIITWPSPYNVNNQIDGNPPLRIDQNTGMISVVPRFSGLYVFAFTVEEYRAGVKIGEVRRDVQVKVNNCPTSAKPSISLRVPGASQNYRPGDTLFVTDATDYCYPLKFSDPDVGQTLTIKVEPVNFTLAPVVTPSSGVIQQAGQVLDAQICWADCNLNSPNQLYRVNIIVLDNSPCFSVASDTLKLSFLVVPKPNAKPQVNTLNLVNNEATANVYQPLTFNLLSTDADKDDLVLRMAGVGFDPAAEGMELKPLTGKESFQSVFSWTPDCNQINQREFYELKFIVKDNSCFGDHEDTVSVKIRIRDAEDEAVFLPPNIFTPNDDNRNDFFRAPTLPVDKCGDTFQEVRIYNRWGQLVYKSADRQFAWDGKGVSDGVYFYAITFQKRLYKGHITIVR